MKCWQCCESLNRKILLRQKLNNPLYGNRLLNQAHAWFLKIDIVRTSVCVSVSVSVCVSAPQAIKNYSREMKSE